MNTINELIDAVTSYLYDRKDLASAIPTFIDVADRKIHRRLRTPTIEVTVPIAITGTNNAPLPDDYLEAKLVVWNGLPLTRISDTDYLESVKSLPAEGIPREFARIGNELVIFPRSGEDGTLYLTYYADYSGNLTAGNVSPIFNQAPDVYLHGALMEASAFLGQDSRVPVWQSSYASEMAELQDQADMAEYSGSTIAVRNSTGTQSDGN